MKPLRIAIVGCGRMGNQHARSVAQLGHTVAVVCDPDAARASTLAAAYPGCAVLTDPAELRYDQLDAVFVCTPPFARGPVEVAALRAGVPVFLEKPIGLSAAQLQSALQAAQQNAVVTSVGYMNRYRPSVQRVRQIAQREKALGFTAHWVGAAYRVPWWGDPKLSGGQLNEQCTHVIDLARYLAGEIAEVTAFSQPGGVSTSILLRFESGALGTILCACSASEKQIGARVFTPRGQLVLESWDFRWAPSAQFGDGSDLEKFDDVFLAECAAFLDAVRSGDASAIRCDLADAMKTQQVVDAAAAALSGTGHAAVARVEGERHAAQRT